MLSFVSRAWVGMIIFLAAISQAVAIPISGTYTGTASGSLFQGGFPELEFTGSVRGSIFFETDIPQDADIQREPTALRVFAGPPVQISFSVTAGDLILDLGGDFLGLSSFELFDDGVHQSLRIGETDVCCSASSFELVSASHKLFRDFDLATFNPNDIDLSRSQGFFSGRFLGGFTVTPTSFDFGELGGVSAAEPASLATLLLGLCLLAYYKGQGGSRLPQ
jgi:hypothetical protein